MITVAPIHSILRWFGEDNATTSGDVSWVAMVVIAEADFKTFDALLKHFADVTDFTQITNALELRTVVGTFYSLVFKKLKDPQTDDLLYVDPCSFLVDRFSAIGHKQLKTDLMLLHDQVMEGAARHFRSQGKEQETPTPSISIVPPVPSANNHSKHTLALWQLGYTEDHLVRGAPGSNASLDVLTSTLVSEEGLNTKKYNIDVVFSLDKMAQPGSDIQPFSVCVSEGASSICGCFLLIYFVMQFELNSTLSPDLWDSLCPLLLTNFLLHTHYEPADTLERQVQSSIANKCLAGARQRPNILNMVFAFARVASFNHGSG